MTQGRTFADSAGLAQAVEVRSRGSFSTAAVTWQRGSGEIIATIIAKATYALDPEVAALLEEPDPIHEVDDHWDDDLRKSVRMPSDLAPIKNTYDIVVVGHAYAAKAAESTVLRVAVGSVDKCVEARVSSRFSPDGQLDAAAPTLRMPLRYEVGPLGLDNPVGIDPTLYDEVAGSYRVPQLLPPDVAAKPGVSVPFTGVGPIAPSWRPRASLLRAQDRAWLGAMIERPMPTGFDAAYFSIAPADQRASEGFRHDERILLECLHPQHPRLVANLAGVRPVLSSNLGGKLPSFTGDTLVIDSDRGVVTLTFRALVEIDVNRQTRFEVHADNGRPRRSNARPGARFEESTMKLDGKTIDAVVEGLDTTNPDGVPEAGSPLPFPATARKTRLPSQAFDGLPFRTGGDAPPSTRPRSEPAPASRAPLSVLGRSETLTDTADPLPSIPAARTPAPPALSPPSALTPPRAPLSRPPLAPVPPPPASVPGSAAPPPPPASVLRPPSSAPIGLASAPLGGLGGPLAGPPPLAPLSALAPLGAPAPLAPLAPVGLSSPGLATPGPRPSPPALVPSAQTVGEQRAQLHTALPAVVSDERRIRANTGKEPGREDPFGSAFSGAAKSQPHASAKLASDEAAGRAEAKPAARSEPEREMTARKCLVDLLGCAEEVPRRLRRSRTFSSLLAEFAPPRALRRLDEADGDREKDRDERQRLDVLRVLSCGDPLDGSGLTHSLDSALDDPNDLEIPILLTSGELKPTFDELETLKLAVKIAQPLSPTDKRLVSAVALANEVLGASPSAETCISLTKQLEGAVAGLNFPARYLADNIERALLDARAYKKRLVLGQSRIRCDLIIGGASGLPCYVPEDIGPKLPLLHSFPVVALVEVRPREDVFESHHEALVVLALGRVLRRVRR